MTTSRAHRVRTFGESNAMRLIREAMVKLAAAAESLKRSQEHASELNALDLSFKELGHAWRMLHDDTWDADLGQQEVPPLRLIKRPMQDLPPHDFIASAHTSSRCAYRWTNQDRERTGYRHIIAERCGYSLAEHVWDEPGALPA